MRFWRISSLDASLAQQWFAFLPRRRRHGFPRRIRSLARCGPAAQAWWPTLSTGRKGTAAYQEEAVLSVYRHWLVQVLAAKPLTASEVRAEGRTLVQSAKASMIL